MRTLLILGISIIISACGGEAGDASFTDGIASGEHRVFVTSSTFQGGFGGLSSADSECQNIAQSAGLELTYKAILSSDSSSASSRLFLTGAVYSIDSTGARVQITEDGSDLWLSGGFPELINFITMDEFGLNRTGNVWTGTNDNGSSAGSGETCLSWTGVGSGRTGTIGGTNGAWLDNSTQLCSNFFRLYCISI